MLRYRVMPTPTGPFALLVDDDAAFALCTTWVTGADDPRLAGGRRDESLHPDLHERLGRYFAGEAIDFDDVPTPAGRPFFVRCWDACRAIPRGETRTYGELATLAGSNPGGARAAGQAMRHNPLPIVIPCHRVLAAGGIGGFAGSDRPADGSVAVKRWLLDHEANGLFAAAVSPAMTRGIG
jgi:methylated-DNA-[protein]-cysteine S-methyltransferase